MKVLVADFGRAHHQGISSNVEPAHNTTKLLCPQRNLEGVNLTGLAEMSTPENTKLCDFTSTNNNDFICTPIAPPASKADFYDIKPALLNLVMKEQFSGVSTDDAATHLNNLLNFVRCRSIRI